MRLNRIILVGLACMPCFAVAQKVTLRLNPPAGKTYVYRGATSSVSKMSGTDMSMSQSYTVSMKVLSNSAGKISFESKISDVKITVPPNSPMKGSAEQIKKMMEGSPVTSTFDSHYHPIAMKSASTNPMMQSMMQGIGGSMGSMATYPDAPVGVGSKWSSNLDIAKLMGKMMPGMTSSGKVPITMQLVRFLSTNGKRCAEISIKMAGSMNMALPAQGGRGMTALIKLSSTGAMVIDLATGMLQSMNSTSVTSTTMGAQSFGSTQKVTMALR